MIRTLNFKRILLREVNHGVQSRMSLRRLDSDIFISSQGQNVVTMHDERIIINPCTLLAFLTTGSEVHACVFPAA